MSTLQDRVKLALKVSGKSKTDLWKGCGVSSATVTTWVKGPNQTISGKNLINAAQILSVNPDWLATGVGEMQSPTSIQSALIKLHLTSQTQSPNQAFHKVELNPAWIKSSLEGVSIDQLTLFFMPDDTMSPTLKQGDFLLLDTQIRTVDKDGIYLLKSKAGEFLKRVNINLDGSFTIKTDNPTSNQETISKFNESGIEIVGRANVAWSERKLK